LEKNVLAKSSVVFRAPWSDRQFFKGRLGNRHLTNQAYPIKYFSGILLSKIINWTYLEMLQSQKAAKYNSMRPPGV